MRDSLSMRLLCILLRLGAALAALALPAAAEPAPQAVIVLDGSGSMGGPLEGQEAVKFDMAREAIRAAVTKADPARPIGLVVAGHRRKGNCSDIELVTPPAPGTAGAIMGRLDRIGTVGKGPLVQALREAAKTFQPGQRGSLILIHDDADNCRQDPCAAAAEILKSSPGLAVDVVTVSLDPLVGQTMSCLAKMTGGRQYEAKDAASLDAAVARALGSAGTGPQGVAAAPVKPAEPVAPPKGRAEGPPRIRIDAALAAGGAAFDRPVAWRVAAKASPDKPLIEETATLLARELPPGDYTVEARVGQVAAKRDVTVAAQGETAARMALGAGALKIVVKANKSGEAISMPFVTILAAPPEGDSKGLGAAISLSRAATGDLVLPAGRYVVRAADGLAVKEAPVTLEPGADAKAEFVMGTGRLQLSALAREGGETLDGAVFLIETDDPDQPQGRRELARSAARNPDFLLPAGTYYATARLGQTEARERVAVGTGAVEKRALVLNAGHLKLSAALDPALTAKGAQGVEYRVYAAGPPERLAASTRDGAPDLVLPQGRYRVAASITGSRLASEAQAEVAAGQIAQTQIKFESAEVRLDTAGASPAEGIRLEVRDARGHVVLRSVAGAARTADLAPGSYVLRSTRSGKAAEEPFELKAGDRRSFGVGS
jgi:Ca-activated chloride channel family protein